MSQPPESPKSAKTVTACLIVIGNEILSGRTKDANLQFLALHLNEIGVRLMEARVIPDVEATIIATVNECRAKFDYVITTGGIGPTHDDITADCVAKAFGVALPEHPEAVARLERHYGDPALFTPARRRMARIPEGGILIDNPVSVAPGFQIGNVFVLAGVPMIVEAMFKSFQHRLVGGKPMLSRTVRINLPEGTIAEPLRGLQERYSDLEIGSYPAFRMGKISTGLVLRGTEAQRLDVAANELAEILRKLGGEPELLAS